LQLAHSRILQQEKMASIGQLATGIAHEINTPTQYLSDNLGFLEHCFPDLIRTAGGPASQGGTALAAAARRNADLDFLVEEVPRALAECRTGVQRIAGIVKAMKDFAHRGSDQAEPADLQQLIHNAVEMSRNEWKLLARLDVRVDREAATLTCHRDRLGQVLLNLLVNAAHALGEARRDPETGLIVVSARRDGEWVEIKVHDNGCGIPPEIRPRIFEPFFTTKPVGRGTGQGLAIVYDIVVNAHQGQIHVDSEVGSGTTFTLRLPAEGPAGSLREEGPGRSAGGAGAQDGPLFTGPGRPVAGS
ncbi:MAG TPA: ATP-binding protein, partial [Kineosporiaceae bacterium]|nr:ATP-binding protein [Kineosporiaceae bacterium]